MENIKIVQTGSSCYTYSDSDNKIDFSISVLNYITERPEDEIPLIISNYFMCDEITDEYHIFATVVWEEIKYENNNYNPYDYDPDPVALLYRDDWSQEKIDKYLLIINGLCNKFYEPSTYYKHFNPNLPKIPLSKFTDEKNIHIANTFRNLANTYGTSGENNNTNENNSENEN